MYLNITDSATSNNKGSSGGLVHYLEKENRTNKIDDVEYWFNNESQRVEPYEVRHTIDNNIARLCRSDAKFFLLNISPSQKEIQHLSDIYGTEGVKEKLKKYAEKVMDEYARNFKRAGVESSEDLVWFAKIEHYRYYSFLDKEVKNGLKKRGERKDGVQMHVQVIISRKDATNSIKLSPMNNSRGKNEKHSLKLGQFNRVAFKQSGENIFDRHFDFDRELKETFAHANVHKNGNIQQKEQMAVLELATTHHHNFEHVNGLASDVANGRFTSVGDMITETGKSISGFIEAMLEPVKPIEPEVNPAELAERKRLNRQMQKNQGLGR